MSELFIRAKRHRDTFTGRRSYMEYKWEDEEPHEEGLYKLTYIPAPPPLRLTDKEAAELYDDKHGAPIEPEEPDISGWTGQSDD